MATVRRALISVFNKTDLMDFARGLSELGVEIISTGGTAGALREAALPVTYVSDLTGFPEILDGRVKTLHPRVHAGILALRGDRHLNQLKEQGIEPIDLVAVNLYPFQETVSKKDVMLEEAIENIDIGGPAMIRAAAKNYQNVLVVVSPKHYPDVLRALRSGQIDEEFRLFLAREAFRHVCAYDAAIASYLGEIKGEAEPFPSTLIFTGELTHILRYGENPHQKAAFYKTPRISGACVGNAVQLTGKELSYNNILDLNAAFELVREFIVPTAVIIKHNNPCGAANAGELAEAYRKAYEGDPVSAFGGIVACNRTVDEETAKEMTKIFLEAVIAPDFTEEALAVLAQKKNLRCLKTGPVFGQTDDRLDLRKVNGGFLLQEADREMAGPEKAGVVTEKQPTEEQLAELAFALTIVKHVKSNAIVLTKNRQLIGVGAGQMNRVGAARIAIAQAKERTKGAVLASDAFFPFRDTVDEAARAGIAAIVQPGGSLRDKESIDACNEYGIPMVFTGMRHFKH